MSSLDLSVIRSLAADLPPRACVYVGLDSAEPGSDAAEDLSLRWRRMASRLAEQGADEATITAIWQRLAQQPLAPAQYAVLASGGSVQFSRSLPGPAQPDLARFAQPSDVLPLLTWLQRHPAYVMVVTDRTGADVTAVGRGAVAGPTSTVVGPDDVIERNAPGGWSQARYQRRAEDSWQHNAAAVAKEVTHALRRVDARLLLIAGDVRAVQLLRDQLPAEVHRGVQVSLLPGGRTQDSSYPVRQAAVASAVADHSAEQVEQLLDDLEARRGPTGAAVEGVAATLSALAEGRVQTLLVVNDPDDEREAWFGPDLLCSDFLPPEPPQAGSWIARGRLVDIAVRAALLTDAEVRVVPPGAGAVPGERIGALCRFTPVPVPAASRR